MLWIIGICVQGGNIMEFSTKKDYNLNVYYVHKTSTLLLVKASTTWTISYLSAFLVHNVLPDTLTKSAEYRAFKMF